MLQQLPLRDVTWKSHLSSSFISINKLPLRLMPASANLFKDADHPFRWFLAPYVNIFVAVAETMEQYRILKPKLKSWLEMITGSKRSSVALTASYISNCCGFMLITVGHLG